MVYSFCKTLCTSVGNRALHRPVLTRKNFGSSDQGAAGSDSVIQGASCWVGQTRACNTQNASATLGAIFQKHRVWSGPKIPTEKYPVLCAEGHVVCQWSKLLASLPYAACVNPWPEPFHPYPRQQIALPPTSWSHSVGRKGAKESDYSS